MTKYKIGDAVLITDSGYRYSSYRSWDGIPFGYQLKEIGRMLKDTPYTVMSIGIHGDIDTNMLLSLATKDMIEEQKVLIVGTEGVKLIKDIKMYRAYNELNA